MVGISQRGGNYGPPIAFLLLAHPQQLGWFDRIEPAPVTGEVLRRVKWMLQITIAFLFIGHGGFGFFQQKDVLRGHWAAIGVPIEGSALWVMGLIEMVAGAGALLVTTRPYLLMLAYWKLGTELLYPIAGRAVDIWEWVERGGDYVAPFALLAVLQLLQSPVQPPCGAVPVRRRASRIR